MSNLPEPIICVDCGLDPAIQREGYTRCTECQRDYEVRLAMKLRATPRHGKMVSAK